MTEKRKVRIPLSIVMPVVADGGLAIKGQVGGRLVPVVMVDMTGRPDVAELVRIHEHLGMGDCFSQWAQAGNRLMLRLQFERPIELAIGLTFELPQQAGLVDQILSARAVYLQHGVEGDSMSTTMDNPRLVIELPPTGFEEEWERLFPSSLTRAFRAQGLKRAAAKEAARDMVERWRKFGSIKIK
jgi:hypothetical protein